jgi:NTP pyrophosphatase (non-canonical NTP hydrolase)
MNWKEYLEQSEKTMSSEFHCDEKEQRILHAVIGILTEIEELLDNHIGDSSDEINRSEELADAFWYCAIIAREYNIDFSQISRKSNNPMETLIRIVKHTCSLLDMLKKKLYYNKPIDESKFKTNFYEVLLNLSDYANQYSINIEETFDINISKLRARYGEKFSSEKAINRNLNLERSILEGIDVNTGEMKIDGKNTLPYNKNIYFD